MGKELKYFLYVSTILGFIIFVGTYYFSDKNKKIPIDQLNYITTK